VHGKNVDATCQRFLENWGTEEIIIYGELEMTVENVVMNYSDVMYT